MRVAGLDPAFANFGMVAADLNQVSGRWQISVKAMELIQTKGAGKHRVVRKSNENLQRGRELFVGLQDFLLEYGPELIFVEVPSGAQSAAAAMGLGLAVGILASIRVPVIEVSPGEIKRLFTKKQEAVPKSLITQWGYKNWPDAPWLMHAKKRVLKNEHLADALACIQAGLTTPTFLQLQAMRGLHETPLSDHNGPASGRRRERRVPMGTLPLDQPTDKRVRRQVRADAG